MFQFCYFFTVLTCLFVGCLDLPKRVGQYELVYETSRDGNVLSIEMANPLMTPIKVTLKSSNESLQSVFSNIEALKLLAGKDTTLVYELQDSAWHLDQIKYSSIFDADIVHDTLPNMTLPFKKGRAFKVIQGYHGKFSHQSDYSRYALDFDMQIGDTILAAREGYVVGIVQAHHRGGNKRKLRDYANFITLYHPDDGVYSQYVHISQNSSMVEMGDSVSAGQAIALSGFVGYTTTPHLHFNVIGKRGDDPIRSVPITFGGLDGEKLKGGITVQNPE